MRDLSYENIPVGGTCFHLNGFARKPVLTQAKGNSNSERNTGNIQNRPECGQKEVRCAS